MHDYQLDPLKVALYSRTAVNLERVCSRWTNITRGFPALWTIVDVEYPTREAASTLKRCLAYSTGLPLTLWISKSLRPDADEMGVDPRFMSLVAANAHRWSEISIELFDERELLLPLATLPRGSFSSLHSARISFWRGVAGASTSDTMLWNLFCTSPQLESVDWMHQHYFRAGLASAPLHQLTRLGLHSLDPPLVLPFLTSCVKLEILLIGITPLSLRDAGGQLLIQSPILLPHLRVLLLRGAINWEPLYSSLTAPALDRLDMSRMEIDGREIERMLCRSKARLRMLAIHWPVKDQGDGIVALLRSSTMQNLKLVRYKPYFAGGRRLGWEDAFDLRPSVPDHVFYTSSSVEAEQYYSSISSMSI
ncbi:hypothetical protein GGF50DRAFT_123084 [Schizophyllum commune]